MASKFTHEGDVLNFGPRSHARRSHRDFLLWPAWAYRVAAPRVRERKLNMFQRAILGLCRAGVVTAAKVGEHLAIHPQLAALIMVELRDMKCLDNAFFTTEHGIRMLEGETVEAHEMVAGYVFQDPWIGELWPRFVDHLDYCELEYGENGFPSLLFGSTGKPKRHKSFMVLPRNEISPSQPSPQSVVDAVSSHRKGLRFTNNRTSWDEEDSSVGHLPSEVIFDRVSFIEENPEPVFLMTYFYISAAADDGADWYVCDPFGFGESVRLKRRIEQVMQDQPALRSIVRRLMRRGLHDGLEEHKRWNEQIRTAARLEVEKRLTVNIQPDEAFQQILEMEIAHQEAQFLGEDCPADKIQGMLRSGLKVLEAVFGKIAKQFPVGENWKRVYVPNPNHRAGQFPEVPHPDKQWLKETYRAAALSVGFDEPVPDTLLTVRPESIWWVANRQQGWRLRSLICAILLTAQNDAAHCLRGIAQRQPGLLRDADWVAEQGGAAGHASNTPTTLAESKRLIETVYSLVGAITGLGPQVATESINEHQ